MSGESTLVLKNKVFDTSKWMQLPRDVVIGHDVLEEIPRLCQDIRLGSSVLLVTGKNTRRIAGDKVESLLKELYTTSTFIADEISLPTIKRCEDSASEFDFLIGIGGGRVIDLAKITAYNLDKKFISVPTAASHDGIASSRASVPMATGHGSLEAEPPVGVVADTSIIAQSPHRLLASGCADIISNYTAILDWDLAHRMRGEPLSEYAVALSRMTAEILVEHADSIKPHDERSAWMVIKALVASGVAMSIAGSSRPASGGEHKFSHALTQLSPVPVYHGEACGLGAIMTMYLHGGNWRNIRDSLRRIGAPTNPGELNIPDDIVVKALLMAKNIRPERFTILDIGLTEKSAEKLVKMLYRE